MAKKEWIKKHNKRIHENTISHIKKKAKKRREYRERYKIRKNDSSRNNRSSEKKE